MKISTIEALEKLTDAVANLAVCASSFVGTNCVAEVITAAQELKNALSEETLD
jgi:hypothetical protein